MLIADYPDHPVILSSCHLVIVAKVERFADEAIGAFRSRCDAEGGGAERDLRYADAG